MLNYGMIPIEPLNMSWYFEKYLRAAQYPFHLIMKKYSELHLYLYQHHYQNLKF